MITLIVPTRNRHYTLSVVARSFYELKLVDEIIFVIDAGEDNTHAFLASLASEFSGKETKILVNDVRLGAAGCRMRGVNAASNKYILFCDDDLFLEERYDEVCYQILLTCDASAVSGRHIFRLPAEDPRAAVKRFGNGLSNRAPFNRYVCQFVDDARYEGDLVLPLVSSVILTHRNLVITYGFDPYYRLGTGYREESDFQMNLFVNDHKIIATNAVHSIHLHASEVRSGGARHSRFVQLWWAISNTNYFYNKYWARYAKRVGLRMPKEVALLWFGIFFTYTLFVRPFRRILPWAIRGFK